MRRHAIFNGYRTLIQKRTGEHAFDPTAEQRILDINDAVFGILRLSPSGDGTIIALHNVSATKQFVALNLQAFAELRASAFRDIISKELYPADSNGVLRIELPPYQVSWLKPLRS